MFDEIKNILPIYESYIKNYKETLLNYLMKF